MHRLMILASVVVLAATGASCARDGANSNDRFSSNMVAPSALGESAAAVSGSQGKPGGGSSSSSLTLVMYTDYNANGLPNWNDQVTFNVSTTATTQPHVDLKCYQNGVLVLGATAGFYAGYPWPWTQIMTLSSPSWTGGGASCTAVLYYFSGRKNVILSTLNFSALQ